MGADEDQREREKRMNMLVEALKIAGVFQSIVDRTDDELIVQLRQNSELRPESVAIMLEEVDNAKPDEINSQGRGRVRFWWD